MIDYDKWQEIFQSIRKHKLRASLTAFGVFWGIFMLVILMGAGTGLENGATSSFDIAKNAVFIWTQRTTVPYEGMPAGRFINLRNQDVEAIKANIPEAATVSARLPMGGNLVITRGEESAGFSVLGDYPQFLEVKPLLITAGRFLNEADMSGKRKVAVIGSRVKEVLFKDASDPLGQYINIKGVPFKVIGVFESRSRGEDAIDDVQTIFIPLTTMQRAFNFGENIGWLALIPRKGVPAAVVEEKTKQLLARIHTVSPDDPGAFGSANVEREFREVQNIFIGIRGFSWLVAIGTIIAGVVGVGNIMMIIVKERTKEIGIRKSVGATPWSIISMILQEALVLTGLAGYAGLALGCLIMAGLQYATNNLGMESDFFYNPQIDFGTAFAAIVVLSLAGIVAGLIPGLRAARIHPVEALRYE